MPRSHPIHMEKVNCTRIIDGNGDWNMNFEGELNLAALNASIGVVSIFGPQSSGKSTLLNYLYGTRFEVLDAIATDGRRRQTTKGISAAKIMSPQGCILVIDTEGTDGEEREDDTKFEKQTAIFTLAISTIVMINMHYTAVGTNNAAGWPLLTTVFEVMLQKFKNPRRKPVRLVFVVRDKPKLQSVNKLPEQVTKKVKKIWAGTAKPESTANDKLEKYFKIEVVPLSNYESMEERFQTEVASLKENTIHWIASGERFAASDFANYAKNIWDEIKKDKDLNLPQLRILVAQACCKAIADEKYQSFLKDESWRQIKDLVVVSPDAVPHFGEKAGSICDFHLSQYDHDAQYYYQTQRDEYKKLLTEKLVKEIEQTYCSLVQQMYRATLKRFFDAAMEEINEYTALDNLKTEDYMTEFQNKVKDAAMKLVNGNRAAKLIAKLKSTMDTVIARARREVNQLREQKKLKDKEIWWKKFATSMVVMGSGGLAVAATVLAAVIAGNSISDSVLIRILKEENPVTAESFASLMASIQRETSEI